MTARGRGDRSKRLLDLVMILLRARTPVTYREIRDSVPRLPDAQRRGRPARVRARQGRPARARRADPLRHARRGRLARGRRLRHRPQALQDARGPAHPRRDLGARARRLGRARDARRHVPEDRRPRAQEARVRSARAARHADRVPAPGAARRPCSSTSPSAAAPLAPRARRDLRDARGGDPPAQARDADLPGRGDRHDRASATSIPTRWSIARARGSSSAGATCARRSARSASIASTRRCMAPKPKSPDFERPADFDVKAYAQRSPWTFTTDPPRRSSSCCRPRRPRSRNEDFGPTGGQAPRRRPHCSITFDCANPEFAATRVLAAKGAIHVVARRPAARADHRRARRDRRALRGGDPRGVMRDVAQKLRRLLLHRAVRRQAPRGRARRPAREACSAPSATSCSPISICSRRSARPTAIRASTCWSPSTKAACSSISRTG